MTLTGMEHTLRQLARAPEVVRKHAALAVGYSALRVAQTARSLVPVDTGLLKSEITAQHKDGTLTGFVGTTSEATFYWYPLEMGYQRNGRQVAARPFFRPAAEQESASFIAQMRDIGPAVEHEMESRGLV
jgi:hypothetical protein